MRTAAACATSYVQLTSSVVRRHGSQARYAAGADGLEEDNFRSTSNKLQTTYNKSLKAFGRCETAEHQVCVEFHGP